MLSERETGMAGEERRGKEGFGKKGGIKGERRAQLFIVQSKT